MPKITLTRGLPASGKTTWAKAQQERDPNLVRVNKDDLRALLHLGKWSRENEKQVLRVRDQIVIDALDRGRNVVVDDTNGHPKHAAQMTAIARLPLFKDRPITVEVKEFDVDVEECVRRDLQRPNSVGERVIRRMHRQFFGGDDLKGRDRYRGGYDDHTGDLPNVVIADLDGTLAILGDRSPYDGQACACDTLNRPVLEAVYGLATQADAEVFIFSGRNGESEPETRAWLEENGVQFNRLVMRQPGDQRKDAVVKREMYDEHVAGHYECVGVFDDRDQVVDLWRKDLRLPCFQVYYGDF